MPGTLVLGYEVLPTPPSASGQASAGWTEEIEVALMGSSLTKEHRALIGAALQGFRSTEARMREVFKGLVMSFEVFFCTYINNNLPA